MPRIRSLKPEFFHDRKLARTTSITARMLYAGLWGLADEHGRLNGDAAFIKGQVFPYDAVDVEALLDELVKGGRVVPYEFDGDPYLFLPKLDKHQRLEAAKVPSRLPAPPDPSTVAPVSESRANESASDLDDPAPSAEKSVLLYVAGGREQVAGSRGTREARPMQIGADESVTAQHIVDAYVQGCRSINAPDPEGNLCGKVGKQAKAMLTKHDPNLLLRAAFNMGAAGWSDLAIQLQRDAAESRPRNTTPQGHRDLIASYENGGQQ